MTRIIEDEADSAPVQDPAHSAPVQPMRPAPSRNGVHPAPVVTAPSTDSEDYVIGCCLLDDGASLDRAISAGLTTPDLTQPRHRLILSTLRQLRSTATPIGLDTLIPALGSKVDEAGGLLSLMALADPEAIGGSTLHLQHHLERILDRAARERIIRRSKALIDRVERGEMVPELSAETAAASGVKKPETAADHESRRVTISAIPPEPVTRLFLAKKPVATPGNLVTLISRAKTGKTAEVGAIVAAIIAAHYDRSGLDTLGFTAPHTKEAVVQIDTEQSLYDAHICHQRAFARANQAEDVPWLLHYALVGYSAAQLRSSLVAIMAKAREAHGSVFALILDGVADFVASVNDEAECNDFITWLRAMAVDYDCPVICVIHSNEALKSGDDGRGHLGKQLTRKAESNLLLKKVGEVTTVTSEKQRKAPITEADGMAFRWSDEHQRHVSCGTQAADKAGPGRPPKYDQAAMLNCFPGPHDPPAGLQTVYRTVGQLPCGISDRAFKDWVAKWVETGEVLRIGDRKAGWGFRRSY